MDASQPTMGDGRGAAGSWTFICPLCRRVLALESTNPKDTRHHALRCPQCNRAYTCSAAIWRFLPDDRRAEYARFLREYHTVRRDQGWGRPDAHYFLALPIVAPGDPQWAVWRRRSKSYSLLCARIIDPLADELGRPLRILDLGAGNCWLAYRLSQLNQHVAAIDLSTDGIDGLGASTWYNRELGQAGRLPFTSIQADFDRLPLPNQAVDVALFNASLHYSTQYEATLREALRVLSSEGVIVIMDSPVYRDRSSGEQMVREREAAFERAYGFRSDSLPAEQFFTWDRLGQLARRLDLRWQRYPLAGQVSRSNLSRRVRTRWRRIRGRRELAEMPVIVGHRGTSGLSADRRSTVSQGWGQE